MSTDEKPINVFSHIPKTAGMNLHSLLRRYYGINYLIISSSKGKRYTTYESLKSVLHMFPNLKSIGGHGMQHWINYKELESRLRWYTFLRWPVDRVISHYQHQTLNKTHQRTFEDFLKNTPYHNWSVRMIAGEENLDKAKQILDEKFSFVGLTERFNESLVIMGTILQMDGFDPRYKSKVNVAKTNTIASDLKKNLLAYNDLILASNSLDIELYKYVESKIFPMQIDAYGGKEKLDKDLAAFTFPFKPSLSHQFNTFSNFLFRNTIVKPCIKFTNKFNSK